MKLTKALMRGAWILALLLSVTPGQAADYPAPAEGTWVVRDFRFHTGEVLPELRLHYTTVGAPSGEPVLILHGTTQSGAAGRPHTREGRRNAEPALERAVQR
jgi:homoserine O-acetyltransferase/O-succinyltransferase